MGLRYFILITTWLTCFNAATQTFHLRPHSEIRNPMGIFVIPTDSTAGWAPTSVTVFSNLDKTNIYLTYNYTVSDIMPPFTSSEYSAAVVKNEFIIKKGTIFARVENSSKTRNINGIAQNTTCGIYDSFGKLKAFCTAKQNTIAFDLKSLDNKLLSQLKRSNNRWEIDINNNGQYNINKTITLMLAALRIWR